MWDLVFPNGGIGVSYLVYVVKDVFEVYPIPTMEATISTRALGLKGDLSPTGKEL